MRTGVKTRRSATFAKGGALPRRLSPPSGFGWSPTFDVVQTGACSFGSNLIPSSLAPATTASFYVDTARANNTGAGTSWSVAEQAIWAALNDVAVGTHATIWIKGSTDPANPTIYPWSKAWRVGTSANLHVRVVSDEAGTPGYAVSSTALVAGDGELGTWGLVGGSQPNTYSATVTTAPNRVIDENVLDADRVASKLTLRASAAEVEANPGSYYHAAGVLYVRTADSRAPSFPSLRPLRGGTSINGQINGARSVYIERLGFEGGSGQAVYVQDGNLTLIDADVRHGQTHGIHVNTAGTLTSATRTLHAIRVRVIANGGDGIAYSAAGSGMVLHGFELDCVYASNSGSSTDQGGSAHRLSTNTAVRVIRVNPTCRGNKTQGFADVGQASDGCEIWMLGGRVSGEVTGVYVGNATKAWLHSMVLAGNTTDLETDDAAGRIYVSGSYYSTTTGAGTVGAYSP